MGIAPHRAPRYHARNSYGQSFPKEPHLMPLGRRELFERLEALGIATQTVEHPPLFTVEDSRASRGEIPGGHTKNLFLKCKKGSLWLVVVHEETRVDLKALAKRLGAGRFSFGNEQLLGEILGVRPGSVTPFALINDSNQRLGVVLDEALQAFGRLNFHPLENSATTGISRDDLITFIHACGHEPLVLPLGDGEQLD
jgi:Ala-tRNA(Pro) deacylase